MSGSLAAEDIDRFIRDGFIRLEAAFSPSLADECRRLLWTELGLDPADPWTWRRPVIRLPGSDAPPFVEAANTPRLLAAFDQLVGPGRWYPRPNVGTFPIRFPSAEDPGDAGPGGTSTAASRLALRSMRTSGPENGPSSCSSSSPTWARTMRRPGSVSDLISTSRRSCRRLGKPACRSIESSATCRGFTIGRSHGRRDRPATSTSAIHSSSTRRRGRIAARCPAFSPSHP